MWKVKHHTDRKPWIVPAAGITGHRKRPHQQLPDKQPKPVTRRTPAPSEPLAFCANCREWTPMRWRPKSERGKRAEQWFQCEYCGGRDLTLRYLSVNEAIIRNRLNRNRTTILSSRKGTSL